MARLLLSVVGLVLVLCAGCDNGSAVQGERPAQSSGSVQLGSPTESSSPTQSGPPQSSTGPTASAPQAKESQTGNSPPVHSVSKLLVVVEENASLDQMSRQMPYTFSLAKRFGYATSYYGLMHPSLPNYLAMVSGQTHGVEDDRSPDVHALPGRTVFGQALAQGRTAAVYADGMPEPCATDSGGDDYAVKHNPWPYFVSERGECRANDLPFRQIGSAIRHGRLPNVGMVVPNLCNDAHDCSLRAADDWFKDLMVKVFAGPDWRSGRLAVVLTADEDDRSQDNKVLTVVIHGSQRSNVVDVRLDHYSLAGLYADVLHAPPLGNAASAASMAKAFDLPVG